MKIAYLMQEGVPDIRERPLGGPANHVWQVFKELQALGHRVDLLARLDGQIWRSPDLEAFESVTVPSLDEGPMRRLESVVRGIQSRLRLPYLNLFESYRFAAACRQEFADYDLFYERMGWMGYGVGLAARQLNVPLVLEVNNGDFITELERLGVAPKGLQRWLAIELMQRAAHRADHVVASGQGHRRRFIEWWGVDGDRVSVVENGTEVVDLLSREQLAAFRSQEELEDSLTVLFVGAFEPWHGVPVLLEAMARVATQMPHVRLVLVGDGTQQEEIMEQIRSLGLEEKVILTGRLAIRQVARELAAAEIGVAPYCGWMEFSGLKLFDYKAAGLAIVASGRDGQPSTLRHRETAWIVPPCEVDALADTIVRLSGDAALRRRLGRAAREEAERCHSWRHTAEQLDAIFSQVVAQ